MGSSSHNGVTDIDRGYVAAIRALAVMDGMQLRIGVQSGKAKYPRKKGGSPVALVANVHGVHKLLGSIYDANRNQIMALVDHGLQLVREGASPTTLVPAVIPYRDAVRDAIREARLTDTYRLMASIGAALYDGKTWIAGDPRSGPDRKMIRAEKRLAKGKSKVTRSAVRLAQRIATKRDKASKRRKK